MLLKHMEQATIIQVMLRFLGKTGLLLCIPISLFGQEAVMNTPFWSNRSYFNASCVGYLGEDVPLSGFLTSKKLWSGIQGSPMVIGFSADYKASESNFVGVQVWQHKYATLNYSSISIPYAFNARIDRDQGFLLGLASTFTSTSIDLSKITQPELLDVTAQIPPVAFFDASFGASYYYLDVFRFGVFANNFMLNSSVDPTKVINYTNYSMSTFGADLSFYLKEDRFRPISLYFDAFLKGNVYTPVLGEASVRIGKYGTLIGLGYRTNNDLNFTLQFGESKPFEFGYFYTHSFSALQKFSNGSQQVYLRFNLID